MKPTVVQSLKSHLVSHLAYGVIFEVFFGYFVHCGNAVACYLHDAVEARISTATLMAAVAVVLLSIPNIWSHLMAVLRRLISLSHFSVAAVARKLLHIVFSVHTASFLIYLASLVTLDYSLRKAPAVIGAVQQTVGKHTPVALHREDNALHKTHQSVRAHRDVVPRTANATARREGQTHS